MAEPYVYASSREDPMFGLIGSIKYWNPSNGIKTNVALAAFLKKWKFIYRYRIMFSIMKRR